jgi:SAM-dependent methyltransferase
MTSLCLGCGNSPLKTEGAINHDLRLDPKRPWVTVAWDLNVLPWPWENGAFDEIVASAVLEHLQINLLMSLNECWRILKPGGTIWIKLPYCRAEQSYDDVTHYWRISLHSFDVFDPDTKNGQKYTFHTDRKWKIVDPARLNDAKTSVIAKLQVRKP